jgi:pimeloyl-ACP methyl ester carboxylesterase
MKATLQDARRYFGNEEGRAVKIRQRVTEELSDAAAAGRRIMLIAHSLGSVIAFDVLWELSRLHDSEVRVDEFVTIGSPLGLNFVQHRMLGAHEHGIRRYPDNIQRWSNLSAIGELTSLDRSMADDYGAMLDAGIVESISDHTDLQTYFRGQDGLNVHRCYGYMANVRVGQVICDWLGRG